MKHIVSSHLKPWSVHLPKSNSVSFVGNAVPPLSRTVPNHHVRVGGRQWQHVPRSHSSSSSSRPPPPSPPPPVPAKSQDDDDDDDVVDWTVSFPPFFFPAVGGLLFGLDIGLSSSVIASISSASTSGVAWVDASTSLGPLEQGVSIG